MTALSCKRCGRTIEPDEPMIVIVVDQAASWDEEGRRAARLDLARGRWHYRCAPAPIKRWASPVMPPRTTL